MGAKLGPQIDQVAPKVPQNLVQGKLCLNDLAENPRHQCYTWLVKIKMVDASFLIHFFYILGPPVSSFNILVNNSGIVSRLVKHQPQCKIPAQRTAKELP